MNAIVAIDAASALLTLVVRAAEAAAKINAMIARAQSEGRDISDEELAAAHLEREAAYDAWRKLAPKGGAA